MSRQNATSAIRLFRAQEGARSSWSTNKCVPRLWCAAPAVLRCLFLRLQLRPPFWHRSDYTAVRNNTYTLNNMSCANINILRQLTNQPTYFFSQTIYDLRLRTLARLMTPRLRDVLRLLRSPQRQEDTVQEHSNMFKYLQHHTLMCKCVFMRFSKIKLAREVYPCENIFINYNISVHRFDIYIVVENSPVRNSQQAHKKEKVHRIKIDGEGQTISFRKTAGQLSHLKYPKLFLTLPLKRIGIENRQESESKQGIGIVQIQTIPNPTAGCFRNN